MKMVTAYIKPFKLNDVHNALHAVGVSGITVCEAKGHGHAKGHSEVLWDTEYVAHFISKLRIEAIVPDALLSHAVKAIMTAARTGHTGDGKVFITTLEDVYRISDGSAGADAL
ncbi:MAG: P-II family nitrogen regulator [Methylocystis sp.]|uniref:P-II family nitrogen regulator n=1 Tax=Methylocystis sp. TaxID=1911079 RepID=UPI003DA60011